MHFIRKEYLQEEWKKTKKQVRYLKELKEQSVEKSIISIKKAHSCIARLADDVRAAEANSVSILFLNIISYIKYNT